MEILSANVENQKVLIMVYQKFKDSNPGTWEQLLMEAESKSRDCLLQIFSMDFDEDTPLMLMRFRILIKKLQNFSSSVLIRSSEDDRGCPCVLCTSQPAMYKDPMEDWIWLLLISSHLSLAIDRGAASVAIGKETFPNRAPGQCNNELEPFPPLFQQR